MNNQIVPVSINFIKEHDYQQWLPCWESYLEFYQAVLPESITKTTWNRFITPNEHIYCAVAKENNNIIGFVTFLYHRSTWALDYYCYLEDLFVFPAARGKQVGAQLINFVSQQAKNSHITRLYWHTQETNIKAQRLYNQLAIKSGMIEYRMF